MRSGNLITPQIKRLIGKTTQRFESADVVELGAKKKVRTIAPSVKTPPAPATCGESRAHHRRAKTITGKRAARIRWARLGVEPGGWSLGRKLYPVEGQYGTRFELAFGFLQLKIEEQGLTTKHESRGFEVGARPMGRNRARRPSSPEGCRFPKHGRLRVGRIDEL